MFFRNRRECMHRLRGMDASGSPYIWKVYASGYTGTIWCRDWSETSLTFLKTKLSRRMVEHETPFAFCYYKLLRFNLHGCHLMNYSTVALAAWYIYNLSILALMSTIGFVCTSKSLSLE